MLYLGVEITAKKGASVPFAHREIDLVAMRGGERGEIYVSNDHHLELGAVIVTN